MVLRFLTLSIRYAFNVIASLVRSPTLHTGTVHVEDGNASHHKGRMISEGLPRFVRGMSPALSEEGENDDR